MSNYIPTTGEIRRNYWLGTALRSTDGAREYAAFERWLEQHDAEFAKATGERIIKLLEDVKADLRKKLLEVSGDSQSETYWYSRVQQLDNYIALIKREVK